MLQEYDVLEWKFYFDLHSTYGNWQESNEFDYEFIWHWERESEELTLQIFDGNGHLRSPLGIVQMLYNAGCDMDGADEEMREIIDTFFYADSISEAKEQCAAFNRPYLFQCYIDALYEPDRGLNNVH